MVDQNIVTNITATANFSSLTAQLSAVTSELVKLQATTIGLNKNLSNQIGVMNRSFVETMRSTGQFSSHFVTLTSDVETFGKKLDSGRLKLGDYYKTWRDHASKTSNIVRDLAKQQVLMQQAVVQPLGRNAQGQMQYNVMLANGLDELKNRTALLRQESLIMNKVMQDGANQLINWGKNTQWAGRQLTVGLTVPLAAFGVAASKAFREADQELVRLTKVYGGLAQTSQADLAKVRRDVSATAKELASTYGASFKDTISLAADIAATGKEGDDLLKATVQTTRLAILGEVDRQDAMKATLAIQSAFKQSTEELTESIDFLNAVENQTSTTLEDLVEAIPKAGPVVQSLGGDVKDLALYLTAMREGGINASEGANALKSALASIINPTKVAKEMFSGFGINLESIVTNNAGNLTNTILALQGALDTLDPLSKSRAIEQLFGKFQFARMNALFANLGKEGSQTLQVIDLMKSSTMDLANISARELSAITESASGKYRRALESVKADLAGVGETFLKINTYVLQTIDGIVKFVTKLPEPIKNILTFMGSLTAIAGPLIMLTGVLGNFFGYIVKGIFHIKNLFKGGQGWKLLTTDMMAAEHASGLIEKSFYDDAKATAILSEAVHTLADSFDILKVKALEASSVVSTGIKTMSGNPVVTPAGMYQQRIADKGSPYIGQPYSRQMAHLIPSAQEQPGTIFGTVPNPGPVNVRVSNNPQMYMADDLPRVPGVTSISGVSTGIVASEAAKWHAMTAAIAAQSEAELALLKTEVKATGTVTHELSSVYQAMLPQMTDLTELAAEEGKLIVTQLQAGVLTVEQARAKIIQLNATIEIMMAETASQVAAGMGRSINLTTVPLTRQPVVDPVTGKSNMKELFHKGATADLMDDIARGLGGVRTSGGGYSIETTKPSGIILPRRGPSRGFNDGGYVYTLNDGPVVPGDTSINYDNTLAKVPEGGFVLNQDATRNNPQLVQYAKTHKPYRTGGYIDAMLTPGETVFTPEQTAEMLPVLEAANSGQKIEFRNAGGVLGGVINARRLNYGRKNSSDMLARAATGRQAFNDVATFMSNPRWEQEFKSRAVLNDSMALFMAGEKHGMTMQEAINIAEAMEDEAFSAAHIGGQFSQSEYDAISQEQIKHWEKKLKEQYPDIKLVDDRPKTRTGKSQRASLLTGASGIAKRTAILELMKNDPRFDPRVLSTISIGKHGFDRAHTRPMGSWDHQGVGYLRQAIVTDQTPNYASNQLSIYGVGRDILPRTTQGALDVIDERARILGFDSIKDYFEKEEIKKKGRVSKNPKAFNEFIMAFARRNPAAFRGRLAFNNAGGVLGGMINSARSHYGRLFLGMPKTIKQVEAQRLAKKQMEDASKAVEVSRFAKDEPTDFGKLVEKTTGHSFPVKGIGGVYEKPDGTRVFVKPVLDEKAALAERRSTIIQRGAHDIDTPMQEIRVMKDPTDPSGKRKLLVLESPYDAKFANMPQTFDENEYFRQLVAAGLRGDKDLSRGNLGGNRVADVGTSGVFDKASGLREYSKAMPSMEEQIRINLLGVKGGAKRFFAESTAGIARNLTPAQYSEKMLAEIDRVLPKLKDTIARFDLNAEEYALYQAMIRRLEDSKSVNWAEMHGTHLAVTASKEKTLTPAALAKIAEAEALKRRQKGHAVGLYDMGFKSDANGFNYGGPIQARALGGPVARSNPYLVGENGPEIFVPGTSGKILPAGFNKGGAIPGYNLGAFIGKGFIKQMIMSTIVAMVGQQIGQAVGGTAGQVISTAAYMVPIGMGGSRALKKPKGNTWQDPAHGPLGIERAAAKTWASRVPTSFTKPLPGMEKASANLAKLGANGGRFSAVLTRLGPMLARLPLLLNPAGLAFAAVTLAVAGGVVAHKKHAEAMRLNALGYGLTAEAAKKAGLKVTDYSAKLKQTMENAKLLREKNHLIFESMKFANTPLDITIKEFKALKKEVNSVYADQVKLFDQTKREDVGDLAIRLKAQFIGAGMSAEDATKKIYAMIAASNKADLATVATVGNETFANIKTGMDAAKVGVATYEDAASKRGRNWWWADPRNVKDPEAQVAAFNSALQSIDTAVAEVIAKDKERIVKEGGDLSKVISTYEAEQQVLRDINKTKSAGVTLTEETIAELSKTNPVLATILDTSDTIASAWEKNTLLQRGFVHDLGNFLPEQAHAALVISDAVQSAVDSIAKSKYFKTQYDLIDSYGRTIDKLRKAAAGQRVEDQISDRKKLESINKQIKANNDLYNARRKALEAQRAENSLQTEIAKKRIEIQQAASTGNTSDAQILQLDLNDLLDQQQTDSMLKALETANIAANKPLEAAADALAASQQKLADTAAIAQQSLADYIAKQDKLKDKTSAFAGLMGTYYTNLSTATDPEAWSQTQDALDQIAAIGKAAEAAGLKLADFDPSKDAFKDAQAFVKEFGNQIAGSKFMTDGMVVTAQKVVIQRQADILNTASTDPEWKKQGYTSKMGPNGPVVVDAAGNPVNHNELSGIARSMPYQTKHTQALLKKIGVSGSQWGVQSQEAWNKMMDIHIPILGSGTQVTVDGVGKASKETLVKLYENAKKNGIDVSKFTANAFGIVGKNVYQPETGETYPSITYTTDGFVRARVGNKMQTIGRWFNKGPMANEFYTYAGGGSVSGPGTSTSDSIPAMLSDGEYVIKADSVKKYGTETFDALNSQKFHKGGLAGHKHRQFASPDGKEITPEGKSWKSFLTNALPTIAVGPLGIMSQFKTLAGAWKQRNSAGEIFPTNSGNYIYVVVSDPAKDLNQRHKNYKPLLDAMKMLSNETGLNFIPISSADQRPSKFDNYILAKFKNNNERGASAGSEAPDGHLGHSPKQPEGSLGQINLPQNTSWEYNLPLFKNIPRDLAVHEMIHLLSTVTKRTDVKGVDTGHAFGTNPYGLSAYDIMQPNISGLNSYINREDILSIRNRFNLDNKPFDASQFKFKGMNLDEMGNSLDNPVKKAEGGSVFGAGTATSDSIPAMLSNGEYVIKEKAVRQYGSGLFDALNAQKFHTGGPVHPHRADGSHPTSMSATTPEKIASQGAALDKLLEKNPDYYKNKNGEWVKRGPSLWSTFTTAENWRLAFGQGHSPSGPIHEETKKAILTLLMGNGAYERYNSGKLPAGGEYLTAAINIALARVGGVQGNALARTLVEGFGAAKGIPNLGHLLPKGSLPFFGKTFSGLASNLGLAATIGLAKPFVDSRIASTLTAAQRPAAISQQATRGPVDEMAQMLNQSVHPGTASKIAIQKQINLAAEIAREQGRFAPKLIGKGSVASVPNPRFLFTENLDVYSDDILSWPWSPAIKADAADPYSNTSPRFWESVYVPKEIEKLTYKQKKVIAHLAGIKVPFGRPFPKITDAEMNTGYNWFYKDEDLVKQWGDWNAYKEHMLGSVGLRAPAQSKSEFVEYNEAQLLKDSLEHVRLKNSDGTDSFAFKYTIGQAEADPRWSTAFGSKTSVVQGGQGDRGSLMLDGDLGAALRRQYATVYEDLIKTGVIRRARIDKKGKRIEDKDLAPKPYSKGKDPYIGSAMTYDEFLLAVSSQLPGISTSSRQMTGTANPLATRPTPFTIALNESYAKTILGRDPLEKLRFTKYDIFGSPLVDEFGNPKAAGYYSLDAGFDYAKNPGSHGWRAPVDQDSRWKNMPLTKGKFQIDLAPREFPSPAFAGGGFTDEFAIIVPEWLAIEKSRLVKKHAESDFTDPMSADAGRYLHSSRFFQPTKGWTVDEATAAAGGTFGIQKEQFGILADLLNTGKVQTRVLNDGRFGYDDAAREITPWTEDDLWRIVTSYNDNAIIKEGNTRRINPDWLQGMSGNSYSSMDQMLKVEELVNLIRIHIQKKDPIKMLEPRVDTSRPPMTITIPKPKLANGGMIDIPKFDSGINMVPADMIAMIHKNEAIIPANMNPFNPNANSTMMSGATYNITNNINGADQDINVLSDMVSRKTIDAIRQIDRINAKMVGTGRSN